MDAFLHFISIQFKNSCSSDGQSSQNFQDFSFNQSWIASVIGVDDEISYREVGIPKDWKLSNMEPSSLLLNQNGGEMSPGQVSSAVVATLGGDNYRIG